MKRFKHNLWWILTLLLSVSIASAQMADCPAILESALNQTNEFCDDTSRNQACYGHEAVIASGQPDADSFSFEIIGDRVDVATIQSIKIGQLQESVDLWGMVLMRLQANLPNTIPGQSVTLLMFGDVELENVAQSVEQQRKAQLPIMVTTIQGANIRTEPSATGEVLSSASPGFETTAIGRSLDSEWVNIELPDGEIGWVYSTLVRMDGDINQLSVTEGLTELTYAPMQAFYMRSGVGQGDCSELGNGALIQSSDFTDEDGKQIEIPTPNGGITLNINNTEITVQPNSTALVSTKDDNMEVSSIEGSTTVNDGNRIIPLTPGMTGIVPITPFGSSPSGLTQITIEPLEIDGLDNIPFGGLGRGITVPDSVDADTIDLFEQFGDLIVAIGVDNANDLIEFLSGYDCSFVAQGDSNNSCSTDEISEIIDYLEAQGYDLNELAQNNEVVGDVFVASNVVSASAVDNTCLGCSIVTATPEPPVDDPIVTPEPDNIVTTPPQNTQSNNDGAQAEPAEDNDKDKDDDNDSGGGSGSSGGTGDDGPPSME